METFITSLLFYIPVTVMGLVFVFICFLMSEYMSCIERLKNELPPERRTSDLHMSYNQHKALQLAGKEHPEVAQRMKYLFKLGMKSVVVLVMSLAISIAGGIVTGKIN